MRQVPVDRRAQAVAEIGAGFEAEQLASPVGVDASSRLPVGLAGVPDDTPLEAGEFGDDLNEFLDQQFAVGAKVDRFVTVVELGSSDDAISDVSAAPS